MKKKSPLMDIMKEMPNKKKSSMKKAEPSKDVSDKFLKHFGKKK